MVTEELISYIKSQLEAGLERNEIVKVLKSQGGWQETDIADAFAEIGKEKLPNIDHQKVGGEMSKPSAVSEDKSIITGKQAVQPVQQNDSTNKDMLRAQEEQSGIQPVQAQSVQPTQETHHPDSILGQVAGQKKGGGGKKAITTIIFIIVLLGGCAGGVYGYYTYFTNPKPLDLLLASAAKSMEVTVAKEKGNFEFGLNMEINDEENTAMQNFFVSDKTSFNYLVSYDVAYDTSDTANQKVDGALTFGVTGNMGFMEVNFDGALDMKMVDNVIYLRLRDTTPFMEFDLSEYEDRWVEIDLENIMPGIGINIEDLMATQEEQQEEVEKMLKKLLSNSNIVEIINRSGKVEKEKDVNGNEEYKLTLQINKEDWKILIKEVMAVSKDLIVETMEQEMQNSIQYPGYEEPSPEEIFAEINTAIDSEEAGKIFEILENFTIQTWIAKDTMLTRKTVFSLKAEGITIEDEYTGKITIGVNLTGESEVDYDVVVDVVSPEDTTPLQEFIEEVSGVLMEDTERKYGDALVKTHLVSIYPFAGLYYDDNNNYGTSVEVSEEACFTEGTLFMDNLSISQSLRNVLKELTGDKAPICGISKDEQSYIVSVELNNGLWHCVDSTGASYEIDQPLMKEDTFCPEESEIYGGNEFNEVFVDFEKMEGLEDFEIPGDFGDFEAFDEEVVL